MIKNVSPLPQVVALVHWYLKNRREFPWRSSNDPYRIWISETMLQQTTTTAVVPYFERFIARFPNLEALAQASSEHVMEAWAGLGYYSRARNLHKAARLLHEQGPFPQSHIQLAEYPGFGPYTSRAVASLAFLEPVGVVDGNVIRVLARWSGQDWEWWRPKARAEIQTMADTWVRGLSSSDVNQALMELGRTVCTPKSPSCLLCPIQSQCQTRGTDKINERPLTRPNRPREMWSWEPAVTLRRGAVLLRPNSELPFLRGQLLPPGNAKRIERRPKKFDYRHSITHHDIFVTVKPPVNKLQADDQWIPLKEIRQYVPAALVHKALAHVVDRNPPDRTVRLPALPTKSGARSQHRGRD